MSTENRSAHLKTEIETNLVEGELRKTSYLPGSHGLDDWYRKEGIIEIRDELYGFAYERNGDSLSFGYEKSSDGRNPKLEDIEAEEPLSQIEILDVFTEDMRKLGKVISYLEAEP